MLEIVRTESKLAPQAQHLLPDLDMKAFETDNMGRTRFELRNSQFLVDVRIQSRLSPRSRRALALAVYRQLCRVIKIETEGFIRHTDHGSYGFTEEERGLSLAQAPNIHSNNGRIGYQIRMTRLKLGLTQKEFSQLADISRSHLSDLEKGKYRVREKTAAKINRILTLGRQKRR